MPPQQAQPLPPIGAPVPQNVTFTTPEEKTGEAVRKFGRLAGGFWENLNPFTALSGVLRYIYEPNAVIDDVATNVALGISKAVPEAEKGQYGQAALSVASGLPVLGPPAQKIQAGDYLGATGNLAALATPFAVARMAPKSAGVPAIARSSNPDLARAMDTAIDAGVPLGTATASGRPLLARTQYAADATSFLGLKDWDTPVAKGFNAMGGQLAKDIRPGPVTSGELAGTSVIDAFQALIRKYKGEADTAYADLRTMARDPKYTQVVEVVEQAKDATGKPRTNPDGTPMMQPVKRPMEAPVDMRAAKAELRHDYEVLDKTLTAAKREHDPGFTAMKNIIEGQDYVPLEVALKNYSALGGGSVGTEAAGLRGAGEGLSAYSFKKVKAAINETLATMGLPAEKAFAEGRFAHRHMKNTAETLDAIAPMKEGVGREAVQAFDRLVRPNDANLSMLRRVNAAAPQELQTLGRAAFEDHLTRMTAHGGLEHTKAALNWWDRLGPKTKEMLWPDQKVRERVGDFFLAMKTWADSPNPSGTAGVTIMAHTLRTLVGGGVVYNPAAGAAIQVGAGGTSLALHSPRVAKALVHGGTRVPIRTPLTIGAGANVAGQAATDAATPPPMVASHEKTVTRAQLEAVAQMNNTDVATEEARAKAEGYVIR